MCHLEKWKMIERSDRIFSKLHNDEKMRAKNEVFKDLRKYFMKAFT
jgi:hypothetical protein